MSETFRSALVRRFRSKEMTFTKPDIFEIMTGREVFIRQAAADPFAKCQNTQTHKSTRFRNVPLGPREGDTVE